jgi:hypothetical protein
MESGHSRLTPGERRLFRHALLRMEQKTPKCRQLATLRCDLLHGTISLRLASRLWVSDRSRTAYVRQYNRKIFAFGADNLNNTV